MRVALLAAGFMALFAPVSALAITAPDKAPALRHEGAIAAPLAATAPPDAEAGRQYAKPIDALLAADLDYIAREADRRALDGEDASLWALARFGNAFADRRYDDARAALAGAPGGLQSGLADALEPWIILAEGHADDAVSRIGANLDRYGAPLPDVARALIFEAAGRLPEAAAVYAQMEQRLDLTPPPEQEPATMEEWTRSLNSARITHAMYRAAILRHRLGDTNEARRLYGVVLTFAPRSTDVERNLARLNAGEGPREAVLDNQSALGRWLLFMSEYVTQSETIARTIADRGPQEGLASQVGALFLQLGVALSLDAEDWRLYAADQLADADGLEGAERLLGKIPSDGYYAPDAELARADILLKRKDDRAAADAALRAIASAPGRWAVLVTGADVLRAAGRQPEAIDALNRALGLARTDDERADVHVWRAFAHRFAGDQRAATVDIRAALALAPDVNRRMLAVSVLMDDPEGWREGVAVARQLFAEQPDSVMRLNALGYALIQHSEGLEEGYRLLWRGFNFGQSDYAVIDSLGWAYYLYGHFEEAEALIERADELTGAERNPEVLDHLGDVRWRLGDERGAREAWRLALDFRPEAPRRASLETKIARGLRTRAPTRRDLPTVELPDGRAERGDT